MYRLYYFLCGLIFGLWSKIDPHELTFFQACGIVILIVGLMVAVVLWTLHEFKNHTDPD